MSRKILIKNGRLWSAHDDFIGDIWVVDDKIAAVGRHMGDLYHADEVIDADGLYVFPGGIDPHTHLDLPFMGTFSADDFETGTLAGLHGGTTSVIDLAIQSKGDSLANAVAAWQEKAMGKAVGDYTFHCGIAEITPEVRAEIPVMIKEEGLTSFKVFMAYKGALMVDDGVLLGLMEETSKYGGIVTVHAENGDLVEAMVEKCRKEGWMEPKHHLVAHPAETEAEAAGRIMDLARYNGAALYIVHTTYRGVLDRAYQAFRRDQRVFIETCPQYLLLDDSVYSKPNFEGAKYVMSPPIRKKDDQEALWYGLQAGHVQTIGTDHCPFNFVGQKDMGKDDFTKIPNGAGGIEHRMELLFSEGVLKNRITMNRYVEVLCTNVANIFGLEGKGSLAPGKDADIVLFDPKETHTISTETQHQNVDNNIYDGWNVTGKVKTVLLNGKVVIRDGRADEIEKGQGRYLKRKPFNYAF
jgi:dihydropyrimidinase